MLLVFLIVTLIVLLLFMYCAILLAGRISQDERDVYLDPTEKRALK